MRAWEARALPLGDTRLLLASLTRGRVAGQGKSKICRQPRPPVSIHCSWSTTPERSKTLCTGLRRRAESDTGSLTKRDLALRNLRGHLSADGAHFLPRESLLRSIGNLSIYVCFVDIGGSEVQRPFLSSRQEPTSGQLVSTSRQPAERKPPIGSKYMVSDEKGLERIVSAPNRRAREGRGRTRRNAR